LILRNPAWNISNPLITDHAMRLSSIWTVLS
jgi:hypothetical protein